MTSGADALTDTDRWPLLDEASSARLRRLRQHPHAPHYNYLVGERLSAEALDRVREYADALQADVAAATTSLEPSGLPPWLPAFVEFCRREVPFYRRRADWTDDFLALPPLTREDLRREPWAFVPDTADLSELVVYTTSGTLGSRLKLPSHPETPNRYLPLIQAALASVQVQLAGGDRVSIIHVCAQRQTYVLCSVMSYLGGAGFAKINLHPGAWRNPDDAVQFLDDCQAEIYTGDPFAFSELARLPTRHQPRAIVSSATALLPGLARELEARFACPVLDLYSMQESGPVAYARPAAAAKPARHALFAAELHVEILTPDGRVALPGERGEIVVTGGANPYLPLLRYRTGDYAALESAGPTAAGKPALVEFAGRPPTVFVASDGRRFPSIDVTMALTELPLAAFTLHQAADGSLAFRGRGSAQTLAAAREALAPLCGGRPLEVTPLAEGALWEGKQRQFTSDFAVAATSLSDSPLI